MLIALKSVVSVAFRLVLFLVAAQAQAFTISGTIYGGANPLPNATVVLNDASSGSQLSNVTTDLNGDYSFTMSDGREVKKLIRVEISRV